MVKSSSVATVCAVLLLSACNSAADEAARRARIHAMADSIERARDEEAAAAQRALLEDQQREREERERQFAAQQAALNPSTPSPAFTNPADSAGRSGDSTRPVDDSATAARRRRIDSLTSSTRDTTRRPAPRDTLR